MHELGANLAVIGLLQLILDFAKGYRFGLVEDASLKLRDVDVELLVEVGIGEAVCLQSRIGSSKVVFIIISSKRVEISAEMSVSHNVSDVVHEFGTLTLRLR